MNNTYIICCCLLAMSMLSTYAHDAINSSHNIVTDEDDGTLVSSRGTYELGFFSPDNSHFRYVGIWYKRITPRTVVWVANRDNPLTDTSGALQVTQSGLLLVHRNGSIIIWSANASTSPVARLLDSGNLVVADANGGDNFLWQSFDYPTDTLLPGMKLGWNFANGRELEAYMTSAKNSVDLGSGDFTFHCDPTGYPQNVLKKGSVVQYKSGPWNGLSFSGGQNLKKNSLFTFGVSMSQTRVYYHFEPLDDSVITRFTVSDTGVAERYNWNDQTQNWDLFHTVQRDSCDIYNACGAHGSCNFGNDPGCACLDNFEPKDASGWSRQEWLNGCIRSKPLNCKSGDVFLKYSGVKLPDTQHSWFNTSMSLKECKEECSKNCSCMAYASLDISRGENGCLIWFGDLVNIRSVLSPGQDIYIRLASSELDSKGKKRLVLIVTLALVAGAFLACLSLLLYSKKRNRLDELLRESGRRTLDTPVNHPDGSQNKDLELPQFDLTTIIKATDHFSLNNKLGEGGFGPVYKVFLYQKIIVSTSSSICMSLDCCNYPISIIRATSLAL